MKKIEPLRASNMDVELRLKEVVNQLIEAHNSRIPEEMHSLKCDHPEEKELAQRVCEHIKELDLHTVGKDYASVFICAYCPKCGLRLTSN